MVLMSSVYLFSEMIYNAELLYNPQCECDIGVTSLSVTHSVSNSIINIITLLINQAWSGEKLTWSGWLSSETVFHLSSKPLGGTAHMYFIYSAKHVLQN